MSLSGISLNAVAPDGVKRAFSGSPSEKLPPIAPATPATSAQISHLRSLSPENRPPPCNNIVAQSARRLTARVIDLWAKLRAATTKANISFPIEYADIPGTRPIDSHGGCVKATMVHVDFGEENNAQRHALHANFIELNASTNPNDAKQTRVYVAGQSPTPAISPTPSAPIQPTLFLATEKFLVQGIQSGLGIYQFVSPRAHFFPEQSKESPIHAQLAQKLSTLPNGGRGTLIGGRYEIVSYEDKPLNVEGIASNDTKNSEYSCKLLVVRDNQNRSGDPLTIPITQVGLNFSGRLLRAAEIKKANRILEAHNAEILGQKPAATQTEPAILSGAGIGRNATLIVYREISARIRDGKINDVDTLDSALHDVILQGRKARGPKFIHSDAQFNELRNVLSEELSSRTVEEPPVVLKPQTRAEPSVAPTSPQPAQNNGKHVHWDKPDEAKVDYSKARGPTAADLLAAKKTTGVGMVRSEKGKPFAETAFMLRNNNGGGNCLFHALEGTKESLNLDNVQMKAVRDRVANVQQDKPDTDVGKNANWHQMSISILQKSLEAHEEFLDKYMGKDDSTVAPQEVTNAEFAEFQRTPGNTAGDAEIQQWLEIPENRGKTVTQIDSQIGSESIIKFSYEKESEQIKRDVTTLENIAGDASVVRNLIQEHIKDAVADENSAIHPATHLAIYRSVSHYQRIVRQTSHQEQITAMGEKNDEFLRSIKLAASMSEAEILQRSLDQQ